jgi:hypothetical protein
LGRRRRVLIGGDVIGEGQDEGLEQAEFEQRFLMFMIIGFVDLDW